MEKINQIHLTTQELKRIKEILGELYPFFSQGDQKLIIKLTQLIEQDDK